jgi:farnesyl-diphosphate farnesyltransferase
MTAALQQLLKETSRSFYLTLRVLPRAIRPQIGLAYLLARTTDTIADTELLPVKQRLDSLQKLRGRILGTSDAQLNFGELTRQQTLPAERVLLEKVEDSLAVLRDLSPTDLKLVRQLLDTITSGQELDLRRFGGWGGTTGEPALMARVDVRPTGQTITALQTDVALDDYTYRVAGCVGEFWTKMCVENLFRLPELKNLATPHFEELGVRFGKGLQLINILRDLPKDLRNGRCYIPADKLAEIGLKPGDLLSLVNEAKFRPLYNRYLDLAESHLAAGWEYTNLIPWTHMSLRLACAWPILIGAKTIGRLRTRKILDPQQRIKITRSEVKQIMVRSVLVYAWPSRWRRQFARSAALP